jgi:hypothetical protein
MLNIYRQGDLGITPITKLPADLKVLKTNVLAYGEVTGHKHQLLEREATQFDILEDEKRQMYLNIKQPTDLVHEEHKTITIEKGFYFISHEKEYDYFEREIKKVQD